MPLGIIGEGQAMANETGISRTDLINKLNLSVHGKLTEYQSFTEDACRTDPEFLAHLIAYDAINGQIKDSKVALPIITLASREFHDDLVENSLAHLAMQSPRELLKALKFFATLDYPSRRNKALHSVIHRYLDAKAAMPIKWQRWAIRHRRAVKSLYALTHAKIPSWANDILYRNDYTPGTIFAEVKNLHNMPANMVAATIQKYHLSPLIVSGAMTGAKATQKDSSVIQATMEQMSDTELITQAPALEKKGIGQDDRLKSTFRNRMSQMSARSAVMPKKPTLKTGHKAEEMEDEGLRNMLREAQERQIQAQKDAGRGIEGNWLGIVDRSLSQQQAIELGAHIGAAIAKFVTGKVWLVFCNTEATPMEVTGKSLEEIKGQVKFIFTNGGTSYGVGLAWAREKKLDLDGVFIVGDGGENATPFADEWHKWKSQFDKELPVYLYQTYCPPDHAMSQGGNPKLFEGFMNGATLRDMSLVGYPRGTVGLVQSGKPVIPFTRYDFTSGQVDYFSLPNVVQNMKVERFGLVETIMACPLLTLDTVFNS
jgi:hypothetical protein